MTLRAKADRPNVVIIRLFDPAWRAKTVRRRGLATTARRLQARIIQPMGVRRPVIGVIVHPTQLNPLFGRREPVTDKHLISGGAAIMVRAPVAHWGVAKW